jgi:hypothetical protein
MRRNRIIPGKDFFYFCFKFIEWHLTFGFPLVGSCH